MSELLEFGDLEVKVDGWGGVHIDWSECEDMGGNVGLSPLMMEEIEKARHEVLGDIEIDDDIEDELTNQRDAGGNDVPAVDEMIDDATGEDR